MSASFKHIHSQATQQLVDAVIEMGPEQYARQFSQIVQQFNRETPGGLFARNIFRFGAAELFEKAREKIAAVAELEDD